MEPFTLNHDYTKRDIIDNFSSIIWTERYYGDGQVELVVPAIPDLIGKLPEGIFLGIPESDEIMILESANIEDGKLKTTGISLLSWMNNRFVRTSAIHEDKYWSVGGQNGEPPGKILWDILFNMCCQGSPYLSTVGTAGHIDIGISNPERLVIPGLGLNNYDSSGPNIQIGIPYGPVYNAMRDLATTYQIGMKITLGSYGLQNSTQTQSGSNQQGFPLGFLSYKGLDRTSRQSVLDSQTQSVYSPNPIVRFSPQTDSLTNIKELRSIAALKTLAFAFAPGKPVELNSAAGESSLDRSQNDTQYTGFDLRALMIFADDITTDMVGGNATTLLEILNNRAVKGLAENPYIQAVDGEIVPTSQFKYGIDYNLGDLVEVQGNSGIIQISRVTEYIRSQDESGEKSYPTMMAYTE